MCKSLSSTQSKREIAFIFWENLHSWHKFYTTAGFDGRDKSQLCVKAFLRKIIKICFEVGISEPLWNVFDVIKCHELAGFDILKTSPEKDC